MLNPEDVIRNSFKIISRRSKERDKEKKAQALKKAQEENEAIRSSSKDNNADLKQAECPQNDTCDPLVAAISDRKQSASIIYSQNSQDESYHYHDGRSGSGGSIYIAMETDDVHSVRLVEKSNNPDKISPSPTDVQLMSEEVYETNENDIDIENDDINNGNVEAVEGDKKTKKRRFFRRKKTDDDRRRSTWLPCTFPQYKVSKELATKLESQAVFFAKVMMVKVVQLLTINLVTFTLGYQREISLPFFKTCQDWVYLAFGLFITQTICVRVALTYRARWVKPFAIILMLPSTFIVAFMSSCITVVYNSILIPLVTCTVLLTFILLSFTPYLLRKFVMHRITNLAGCGLCFLSSMVLLFLKEFEEKGLTYWQFISHVWLPAAILSQIVVLVTIVEIQRMIFGLCFNISSKRWHIAALYL